MRPDLDRLEDILSAASDVMTFCEEIDLTEFQTSKQHRYAVLHALTIIGEAANRLSPELRDTHPDLPWRRIIGFRHRLVHGYGDLDLLLVWEVATTMVPGLRMQVAAIHAELARDDG